MSINKQHRDPEAHRRMLEVSVREARNCLVQIVQNERRLPKPEEMADLINIECDLEQKYKVIRIDCFLRIGQDKLSNVRSMCQVVRNKFKQLLLAKEDRSLDWTHLRAAYCKSLPGIEQLLNTIGYFLRGEDFVADESRMTMQATVNFLVDISMLVEEISLYLSGQHNRMGFFKRYLSPHGAFSEAAALTSVNSLLVVSPDEVPEVNVPPPAIRPQENPRPPPAPPEVLCDLCGDEQVALVCSSEACPRRNLCLACDQRWHGHPARRSHKREGANQVNLRRTAATMPRPKTEFPLEPSPQQQPPPAIGLRRVVTGKNAASYKSQLMALSGSGAAKPQSDTDSESDAEKKRTTDHQVNKRNEGVIEREQHSGEQKREKGQKDSDSGICEQERDEQELEQQRELHRQEEQQRELHRQEEQQRELHRKEEQQRELHRQEEQQRELHRKEEQQRGQQRQEEQQREQYRQEEQQREQHRQEEQQRELHRQCPKEKVDAEQRQREQKERENYERVQELEKRQQELEDYQASIKADLYQVLDTEKPMDVEDDFSIVDGCGSQAFLADKQQPSSMVIIDPSVLDHERNELNQLSVTEATLDERQEQLQTYLMTLQRPVEQPSHIVTPASDAASNSAAPPLPQPEVPARPEPRPRPQIPPRPESTPQQYETLARPEVPPRPPPPTLQHQQQQQQQQQQQHEPTKTHSAHSDTDEEYYTPRGISPPPQQPQCQQQQTWACPFCTAISPHSDLKTIASSGRIVCPVCSMTSDAENIAEAAHPEPSPVLFVPNIISNSNANNDATPAAIDTSNVGWWCLICTFFNDHMNGNCQMCTTPRPTDVRTSNTSTSSRVQQEDTAKLLQALSLADARGRDLRLVAAALMTGCSPEEARLEAWIADEWPRRVENARVQASRQYSAEFTPLEASEALADNPHRLASDEEAAAAVLEICGGKRESLVRELRGLYPQLRESDLRSAAGEIDRQRMIEQLNQLAVQRFHSDLSGAGGDHSQQAVVDSSVALHALMAEHGLRSEAMARRLLELQAQGDFKRFQTEDLVEAIKNTESQLDGWHQAVTNYLNKECAICLEQYPRHHFLGMLFCSCEICRCCFHRMVTVNIKDMHITHLVCPACAKPTPNEIDQLEMHFGHVMALIKNFKHPELHFDPEDCALLENKTLDWQIMRNPNFIWCSNCAAGFEVEPDHPLRIKCHNCYGTTCRKCRKPWEDQHKDLSCEQFERWKQENDPEFQARGVAFYLQHHGIECPACHFKYALAAGGCLHFTCRMCRAQFCSGCNRLFDHDENRGLTCRHPRSCLYHLRDFEIARLQTLLKLKRVEFESGGLDDLKVQECQVMEQKEIAEGLKDEACSRRVMPGHANLCDKHYCEYLVTLINKNRLDPVEIMSAEELTAVCRREGIQVSNNKPDALRSLIAKKCPLN